MPRRTSTSGPLESEALCWKQSTWRPFAGPDSWMWSLCGEWMSSMGPPERATPTPLRPWASISEGGNRSRQTEDRSQPQARPLFAAPLAQALGAPSDNLLKDPDAAADNPHFAALPSLPLASLAPDRRLVHQMSLVRHGAPKTCRPRRYRSPPHPSALAGRSKSATHGCIVRPAPGPAR